MCIPSGGALSTEGALPNSGALGAEGAVAYQGAARQGAFGAQGGGTVPNVPPPKYASDCNHCILNAGNMPVMGT